ncbi:MAG: asparagine synthase C-terminal domain-containing protein, partial [Candidatus Firestonebacteria bacterium]
TFYLGIFELPPASYLAVEADEIKHVEKYWELEFSKECRKPVCSFEEAKKSVREALVQAVEKRLVSDVPLGVLLSGGIDSAVITGIISRLLGKKINTFTVGFNDNESFDERKPAAFLAAYYKTLHTEMSAGAKDLGLLEKLVRFYDMPCGDPSALPTFIVAGLARKNVTVALNGDGGDEAFAGYDRFKAALLAEKLPGFVFPAGKILSTLIPRTDAYGGLRTRLERFFKDTGSTDILSRHHSWITACSPELVEQLLGKEAVESFVRPETLYANYLKELPLLHKLLLLNMKTYLPQNLNVKMDRMSMANSLETRSPFLDKKLLELAATLPPEYKIKGGVTKYILREAFKDILPEKTRTAKKHGFGIPLAAWFKGELGIYFKSRLLDVKPHSAAYISSETTLRMYKEHLLGKKDRSKELWLLLQLELWLNTNKF